MISRPTKEEVQRAACILAYSGHKFANTVELVTLREQVKVLRSALGSYAECCDGCTCGDGWSHDIAIEALEHTKPKDGEESSL